jgi:hypothetical protein
LITVKRRRNDLLEHLVRFFNNDGTISGIESIKSNPTSTMDEDISAQVALQTKMLVAFGVKTARSLLHHSNTRVRSNSDLVCSRAALL